MATQTDPELHLQPEGFKSLSALPSKRYRVIYADPPWRYDDKSLRFGEKRRAGSSGVEAHYDSMSLEDIVLCIHPLQLQFADDAYLFLWATNPLLREAFEVMEGWGFNYKTTLTWVKPSIRMGYYFRGRTEHLLFGIKGKPGRLKSQSLGNVVEAPVTRHSQKPEQFYELIEQACDGPYLEMFARRRRHGWDVWGHEAPTEYYPLQQSLVPPKPNDPVGNLEGRDGDSNITAH